MVTTMIELIIRTPIYENVICQQIPSKAVMCWLATSDLKDLYVRKNSKAVPFLVSAV